MTTQRNPWLALTALVVGFFMILLDMTIVAVANPAIMTDLGTDISNVIWVTSAYLLTYAVPLLVTGRLGDKFGPKNIYLIGLAIFIAPTVVTQAPPDWRAATSVPATRSYQARPTWPEGSFAEVR